MPQLTLLLARSKGTGMGIYTHICVLLFISYLKVKAYYYLRNNTGNTRIYIYIYWEIMGKCLAVCRYTGMQYICECSAKYIYIYIYVYICTSSI